MLGLGNMDSSQEILDNGFMFSVFESGPWVAFKFPNNPSTGWIGGGTELFELMVTLTYSAQLPSRALTYAALSVVYLLFS